MLIYNYISKTLFVHFFMNLHAAKALILCKYFYIINIILLLNHISSSVLSLHEYIMDIRLMDPEPQPPKHYRPGGNVSAHIVRPRQFGSLTKCASVCLS